MKHRPLIFIMIALAHLLEPIIKISYFKFTTPFSFSTIISNISQIHTPREIFEFWFLFPLGGLALLGVKRWSYPVFVGVQFYSIYSHMTYEKYTWPYVSEVPFVSSLALLFVNALIVIYFAFPDVRRPFFDRSVRWWETRTRYDMRLPVTFSINNPGQLIDSEILNISQSGIFMGHKGVTEVGTIVLMNINYKDMSITLAGEVKSQHSFNNERGLGIRFSFTNIWENLYMRKIVRQIGHDARLIQKAQEKAAKMAA
jgi:hypothetical protein